MPPIISVLSSHTLGGRTGDTTGIAAAGATAGYVFAQRWGDSSGVKQRITQIEVGLVVTTGFTAAQLVGFDIVIGRSYSASSSGGTALTLTGNNGKLRQASPNSLVTDARISTTAALTAGTVTVDFVPLGQDSVWALAATAGARVSRVYDFTSSEAGGLILAQNEGLIVRNLVAQGAAGTVQFDVDIKYDQVLVEG